jgi:hypothetical protein
MKVKELPFDVIPDAAIVVCIGRRKSGKTVNIIDIFYKKRHSFKYGLVFCGSKSTIKLYEKHFPSSFIFDGYQPEVLAAALDKQERDVEMGKGKPMFVLMDDCFWAKKSILSDPNVRRCFYNGRHSLIFFVLSLQWCFDLVPSLRQQIDFTFLSREKNPGNRERIYKNYNVCFRSLEQFDSCMSNCTMDHETFVLSNAADTDSDKPEDNVYWWKSKFVPGGRKFRVNPGGTWWKYHKQRYNPRHYLGEMAVCTKTSVATKNQRTEIEKVKITRRPRPSEGARRHRNKQWPRIKKTNSSTLAQSVQAAAWLERQRNQNIRPRATAFAKPRIKNIDSNVKYIA